MLSNSYYFILEILDKVTVANIRQLMILGGYHDESVIRKRVNKLVDMGYIKSATPGKHKIYTLTQKGLNEIDKTRKPFDLSSQKLNHEEMVTEAACWLYICKGRSIYDMMFDHEQNSRKEFQKRGHRPDIVFSMHQALEVELSAKRSHKKGQKNGLEDNYNTNKRNYGSQIWIVPKNKRGIIDRLRKLAKDEKYVTITTLEAVKEAVASYDPSTNEPRTEPVKGVPSPLTRKNTKEVTFYD